jgi:hypothetical protein
MFGWRSADPWRRLVVVSVLAGAAIVGCARAPAPIVTESPASPSTGATAAAIELQRLAPNTGCDTIGVDYRTVAIRIDPASNPQVWAETDTGLRLVIRWSNGFTARGGAEPVILGPDGLVVAANGTNISSPEGRFPELAGYFVCPGTTSIGVYETPPQSPGPSSLRTRRLSRSRRCSR